MDENSDWPQCLPTPWRVWGPNISPNGAPLHHLDFAPTSVNPLHWRSRGFEPTWSGDFVCASLAEGLCVSRMVCPTPSESPWMTHSRPLLTPCHHSLNPRHARFKGGPRRVHKDWCTHTRSRCACPSHRRGVTRSKRASMPDTIFMVISCTWSA